VQRLATESAVIFMTGEARCMYARAYCFVASVVTSASLWVVVCSFVFIYLIGCKIGLVGILRARAIV
jgi:hypothetical protein